MEPDLPCPEVTPNNDDKTASDSQKVDWEAVFEDGDKGLIALIKHAKTSVVLKKCSLLVIKTLFNRKNDTAIRSKYETTLDNLLNGEVDFDLQKQKIIELLREIKEYRKQRAKHFEPPPKEPPTTERRSSDEPAITDKDQPQAKIMEADNAKDNIGETFADVCWDVVQQRLDVIQSGISDKKINDEILPFLVSKAFSTKFEAIVRMYIIPVMASKCRGIIVRASNQPVNEQLEFMRNNFEDRKGRDLLWNTWKESWNQVMHKRKLPAKPEKKPTGLLSVLKLGKNKSASTTGAMTIEEWEIKTTEVKTANKHAGEVLDILLEDTGEYQPPIKEDGDMLRDMFGRSAEGIKKEIDALRQIAQQGGNIGKAFDRYQRGKSPGLALFVACYKYPELFLGDSTVLKDMLGGIPENQKTTFMPLILRHLADHI